MISIIRRIKQLQAFFFDMGMAEGVVALPAPKLRALPAPSSEEIIEEMLFSKFIDEKEIIDVSRDLFVSGFYNQAVCEAYKAIDKAVQERSGRNDCSGAGLMDAVFSPKKPELVWSDRKSMSEKDQQAGYQRIFSGSMLGVRNPCTHEHDWIDDPVEALECIVLAQHLLRKVKATRPMIKKSETRDLDINLDERSNRLVGS